MEYNFREIEPKWQKYWVEHQTYKVVENKEKEKFYVLNMFPYPSGAGLHVGHPLGYIAGRAICHTDGATPGRYHGYQYQPLP